MSTLSGNPDTDLIILAEIPDDASLINMCGTDKYLNKLCANPMLWRYKLNNRFGSVYTSTKPASLSWKEWYVWLVQHPPGEDVISKILRLDPIQSYIRQVSENGIIEGSSNYQTWRRLFALAILKQGRLLEEAKQNITRLLEQKIEVLAELKPTLSVYKYQLYFESLLDYELCFENALLIRDEITVEFIFDLLVADLVSNQRLDFTYINLGIALGKYNRVDLFERLLSILEEDSKYDLLHQFALGLTRGGYKDQAKQLLLENNTTLESYFPMVDSISLDKLYEILETSQPEDLAKFLLDSDPRIFQTPEHIHLYFIRLLIYHKSKEAEAFFEEENPRIISNIISNFNYLAVLDINWFVDYIEKFLEHLSIFSLKNISKELFVKLLSYFEGNGDEDMIQHVTAQISIHRLYHLLPTFVDFIANHTPGSLYNLDDVFEYLLINNAAKDMILYVVLYTEEDGDNRYVDYQSKIYVLDETINKDFEIYLLYQKIVETEDVTELLD